MFRPLTTFLDNLDSQPAKNADVIEWSSPVPAFGDCAKATVATLGLNPSNREFVDEHGLELDGADRRFHTLTSLGLNSWKDADSSHIQEIIQSCEDYFDGNPYDRWFRVLDRVVGGTGTSFYSSTAHACHLDLIPYATASKWAELSTSQKSGLLDLAKHGVIQLIQDTKIKVLILNGSSVVAQFEDFCGHTMTKLSVDRWTLGRSGGRQVAGVGYHATVQSLDGYDLGRELLVLGYNHNLQSSFGVTTVAIEGIRSWVDEMTSEWCDR